MLGKFDNKDSMYNFYQCMKQSRTVAPATNKHGRQRYNIFGIQHFNLTEK